MATTLPVQPTTVPAGVVITTPAGVPSSSTGQVAVPATYQSTSLYVGDLHPEVSEGHLFEMFNSIGPVASIRVCRDAVTRRSLGYAYVNFHSPTDAETALDTLNNTVIKDIPCRIMWSQRDPSIRKSGSGNIFIKNLDKEMDHKALSDTFSDFGNILSCKVALDDKGESKGYGFVHYETEEMAERAILKVNGMMVGSQKVFVGPFIPKKERVANRTSNFTNIYVKNIPQDIPDDVVLGCFQQFGEVLSAAVMKDKEGKSRGFGFINMKDHEAAEAAVQELAGKVWSFNGYSNPDAKVLFLGRAQKKTEREAELRRKFAKLQQERAAKYQGVNLYVKNLDDEFGDEWLRTEFSRYGEITSARAMRNEKGDHKGFGFVCFNSPEEANKAVSEMHGRVYGSKPIYVALAQPRDVRRAHLEAQYAQRTKVGRGSYPAQPGIVYAPTGTPVYYPAGPQGAIAHQQFVYPPQQLPIPAGARRAAWPAAPGPNQQPYPQSMHPSASAGYPVPIQQRGGRGVPAGSSQGPRRGYQNAVSGGRGAPVAPQPIGEMEPITVEFLHKMLPEDQFLCVSQRLYPIIIQQQPKLAPKITGMLRSWYLENKQGPEELVRLMQSPEALHAKIQEALQVWQNHVKSQASKEDPSKATSD